MTKRRVRSIKKHHPIKAGRIAFPVEESSASLMATIPANRIHTSTTIRASQSMSAKAAETYRTSGACAKPKVRRSSPQLALPPNSLSPKKYVTPAQMSHPTRDAIRLPTILIPEASKPPSAEVTATIPTTPAAWPMAERSCSTFLKRLESSPATANIRSMKLHRPPTNGSFWFISLFAFSALEHLGHEAARPTAQL